MSCFICFILSCFQEESITAVNQEPCLVTLDSAINEWKWHKKWRGRGLYYCIWPPKATLVKHLRQGGQHVWAFLRPVPLWLTQPCWIWYVCGVRVCVCVCVVWCVWVFVYVCVTQCIFLIFALFVWFLYMYINQLPPPPIIFFVKRWGLFKNLYFRNEQVINLVFFLCPVNYYS